MPGEGDAERLVVLLEARVRDFERNMDKASGTATKNYGRMRKDSQTATQRMEADMVRSTGRINQALSATSTKIGGLGKSMIAGFAGGLVAGGIAGLVSQIGQVAGAVASVGDEARRAGVNVEAFQELKYVAEQNRIGLDSLTDGLKELNLRADEFIVTKGGAAAEAFQRLGYDAETLKEKLADPSALFTEIIGKLGQLDKAAQIRVADEIFGGTGGEKFVQLIGQGEQGIRDTIQQARDLGLVMSQDLIDKAVDLDQKFNAVSTTVGTALKTAIVEASNALGVFLDQFKSVEERTHVRPLQNQLSDVYNRRAGLGGDITQMEQEIAGMGDWNPLKMLREGELAQLKTDFEALTNEAGVLLDRVTELQGRGTTPPPITPALPTTPGSGAPPQRDKAAEELARQEKAVKNLIAGLEFEKSLVGLSALEQQKLTALRQAGAAATDKQRFEIGRLIDETAREQATVDQLTGLYDALGQAGQSAVMGIVDAMADGKIEAEEFGAILSDVLGMAGQFFLNSAFGGLGGGGFNIGKMFGFASGTANTGGRRGEPRGIVHGQEAVIPLPDGGKVPVQIAGPAPAAAPSGYIGDLSINNVINIPAGTSPETGPAIAREVTKELRRQLPDAIQAYNRNPLRRAS